MDRRWRIGRLTESASFRMAGERTLRQGRVTFADGSGVAGALVYVASGDAPTPEIAIRCDGEGRFRIALPTGRFVIEARAPDGRLGSVAIATGVGEAGEPETIAIVLTP